MTQTIWKKKSSGKMFHAENKQTTKRSKKKHATICTALIDSVLFCRLSIPMFEQRSKIRNIFGCLSIHVIFLYALFYSFTLLLIHVIK